MEPLERVSYLTALLGAHSRNRFAALLCPLGITPQHFAALRWISLNDGSTQQEVADLMEVRRNLMVGLVDDLEAAGLVIRGRHPADRRAHALHLTASGRRVLAEGDAAADALDDEMLAPLDPRQRAAFHDALRAMAAAVGQGPGVFPENR